MSDPDFDAVWEQLQDQEVALHVTEDKPHVEPRHQAGHAKRRVRKPTLIDEDWEDPPKGVRKRRRASVRKLDHWADCMECGKWRKLQRAAVPGRRFVCSIVDVDCDEDCDCDEACEC